MRDRTDSFTRLFVYSFIRSAVFRVNESTNQRINAALTALFFFTIPISASAATLTYRHKHHLYSIDASAQKGWKKSAEIWRLHGQEIIPPSTLLVDGDTPPPLPSGITKEQERQWSREAIGASLTSLIGSDIALERGRVTIGRSASGKVIFQGVGMPGRELHLDQTIELTIAALEQGISDIVLPVTETQPEMIITDPALEKEGIRELVALGESDFSNSPAARRHNIDVGLARFNGHVIPHGTVFSFTTVLGPVDASTGYRKELVIKGDRTIPDYGGGLCQVSSTAYRGVWEYGFPIVKRKNHSFTVNHYSPQGTDATVYPPVVDMQFKNDSPGTLLIQTHKIGDKAYFLYYGTRDLRESEIVGPYIWDRVAPPPSKVEYTQGLPPGFRKKIGERIPGMKAIWYRITKRPGSEEVIEPVYSEYEARPFFEQVGVEVLPGTGSGEEINTTKPPRVF